MNPNERANIMFDIETVGVRPGAAILSIAAVPFACAGFDPPEPFYHEINPASCYDIGLHAEDETIEWWDSQSEEARTAAFRGKDDIRTVLAALGTYITELPFAPLIWGKGADFNPVLIACAYYAAGLKLPWSFKNVRCYRTLAAMYPMMPFIPPRLKHHALEDALAQASHAQRIFYWIEKQGGPRFGETAAVV